MLFLLLTTVLASISPADYIYQSDRPKIAAHRGLCSIFPENTLQSFEGAMFLGTDFIELDVVLNKDLECNILDILVIVAHDTYLSVVSNIKDLPQFESKITKRMINGKSRTDWWMLDFTLEELQQVKIKQVRGATRPSMFNGLFTYPTLRQVLTNVRDFNNRTNNARNPSSKPVGILLEIKDYEVMNHMTQFHLQYTGISIVELVIQELQNFGIGTIKDCKNTVPIVLMSFDMNAVKAARELTDLPRVFLLMDLQSQPTSFYAEATKYANIIGANLASVWDLETQSIQPEVKYIRDNQMMVYAWTFQDDNDVTQAMFNSTTSIGIYNTALTMNLQGLITEFPDAAIAYAQKVNYNINQ